MARKITSMLLVIALLTCATSCADDLKQQVYETLDEIDVSEYTAESIMVPTYEKPSIYTERFPEEYEKIAAYGKDGVKYILEYIKENYAKFDEHLDYYNCMFFVSCAYVILEIDEWYDIDLHHPHKHAEELMKIV